MAEEDTATTATATAPAAAAAEQEEPTSTSKAKQQQQQRRSPSDFLKSVLGRPVRVKLNSGIEYRGVLACLDGYLNIAMVRFFGLYE